MTVPINSNKCEIAVFGIVKMAVITILSISISASTLYGQDAVSLCQASDLAEISGSIQSPEELSSWLLKNFHYEMKFLDNPQPIAKVLESRTGDCDDLANLSSQILTNMNLDNKVLIIQFRGISIRHAICIFRNNQGFYNFMSNRELIRTKQTTIKSAIASVYPDCESYKEAKA